MIGILDEKKLSGAIFDSGAPTPEGASHKGEAGIANGPVDRLSPLSELATDGKLGAFV